MSLFGDTFGDPVLVDDAVFVPIANGDSARLGVFLRLEVVQGEPKGRKKVVADVVELFEGGEALLLGGDARSHLEVPDPDVARVGPGRADRVLVGLASVAEPLVGLGSPRERFGVARLELERRLEAYDEAFGSAKRKKKGNDAGERTVQSSTTRSSEPPMLARHAARFE